MRSIFIEHAGTCTTIQDLGRSRLRRMGVPEGGAADKLAMRIANLLVGNDDNDACIECALVGPNVRFTDDATIAICGARAAHLPYWQAFRVCAGETLSLANLREGAYAYLAIAGGIDVPCALASRSTDIRTGWGGFRGRTLRSGDEIPIGRVTIAPDSRKRQVGYHNWYEPGAVRIVRGAESDEFAPDWVDSTYEVTSRSDRMGLRLKGPVMVRSRDLELPSSPVFPGTIQVPPDGQPIVLQADAQTLGGYPKIAHVITVDLPRTAQHRPGSSMRFCHVTLEEAQAHASERARQISLVRTALEAMLA
jgi:antagonist of KipI